MTVTVTGRLQQNQGGVGKGDHVLFLQLPALGLAKKMARWRGPFHFRYISYLRLLSLIFEEPVLNLAAYPQPLQAGFIATVARDTG